jgi:hypothetical protein
MTETTLPIPTGPYRIGTVKYDLTDIYRKELEFPDGRLIPIQIYFPMEKGAHVICPKTFEKRAAISPFEPLKVKVHSQKSASWIMDTLTRICVISMEPLKSE